MTDQATTDAIAQAAAENGIDPAYAMAVAERESQFDPNAHASKTIYGLYQMSGPLRAQYGSGDSDDPYTQSSAWGRFTNDNKADMKSRLGRDPTEQEQYLGHYLGAGRASRIINGDIAPNTPTDQVFTPAEMGANPEFARAGTVGALAQGIQADIGRRMAKYAGDYAPSASNGGAPNFAAFGTPGVDIKVNQPSQTLDFSSFGEPVPTDTDADKTPQNSAETDDEPVRSVAPSSVPHPRPGQDVDLSRFGITMPQVPGLPPAMPTQPQQQPA
jgi:hypothetical protein